LLQTEASTFVQIEFALEMSEPTHTLVRAGRATRPRHNRQELLDFVERCLMVQNFDYRVTGKNVESAWRKND